VQEGDFVKKGDNLISGSPDPHDILEVLGVEALAEYLVAEIQEVYRLQGVKINDKHIEVIVRQMLQKVEITEGGDTTLLAGEQVDLEEMNEYNAKSGAGYVAPPKASRCCSALPRLRCRTRSFISAASFQETTRVLTQAAVEGKKDYADRAQGKRHRWPADPGGHGCGHEPHARRRHQPRCPRCVLPTASCRNRSSRRIRPRKSMRPNWRRAPKRRSAMIRWQRSRARPTAPMPMQAIT